MAYECLGLMESLLRLLWKSGFEFVWLLYDIFKKREAYKLIFVNQGLNR